jgi:hypothetical protein
VGEAGLEQDADLEDAGLDVGVADGTQEHGIELLELLDPAVGQNPAGPLVALARGGSEVPWTEKVGMRGPA